VPSDSGTVSRPCSTNHVIGYVAGYVPVTNLTLTDGSQYDLSGLGEVAPAGLQIGSRVGVEYRDCGDGKRTATAIDLLDGPAETTLRGTVDGASPGRFDLVMRSRGRYAVVYDSETALIGAAIVENGQGVQVKGWLDDKNVLHATEIRVREAPPAPGATEEAAPPATPSEAPPPPTPTREGEGAAPPPTVEAAGEEPVAPVAP
jgi:hypothetical protein